MDDGDADRSATLVRDLLLEAQRLGTLGDRPIDEVIEHARAFVSALSGTQGAVVDLGTGAGIPGLVILLDRPDLRLTLLDRRTARTDALDRGLHRLGWTDRASVAAIDVRTAIARWSGRFDAAVARGFGPSTTTALAGRDLVRPGGIVVISNPPGGHDWPTAWLAAHRLALRPGDSRVSVLEVQPD